MDFEKLQDRIGGRETVPSGIFFLPAPERRVILKEERIFEPASLIEVMGRRAANRIVFSSPRDIGKELGDDKTFRS